MVWACRVVGTGLRREMGLEAGSRRTQNDALVGGVWGSEELGRVESGIWYHVYVQDRFMVVISVKPWDSREHITGLQLRTCS